MLKVFAEVEHEQKTTGALVLAVIVTSMLFPFNSRYTCAVFI